MYGQKIVADCSKPIGQQVTAVDLTRDEVDARDAQRSAADQREQVEEARRTATREKLESATTIAQLREVMLDMLDAGDGGETRTR